MAATEPQPQPQPAQTQHQAHDRPDRSGRRRPFSTWMKKLANLKGGSSHDSNQSTSTKRNTHQMKSHSKKQTGSKNNNPYPESGVLNEQLNDAPASPTTGHLSFSTMPTVHTSRSSPRNSIRSSEDGLPPPTIGNKSMAATMSTDRAHSDAAGSHAPSSADATVNTVGAGRGGDSTFSSPAPSVRSLTTTLTTIHSAAPQAATSSNGNNVQNIQFTHQFPTSPPASALPAHVAPSMSGGHPATYTTATANNLLTDNASILTLASSSKRRRRRSMDTDASVRALAPSSLFGGSRESLPLSVLSTTVETPGLHGARPSMQVPNERASIYSATGVAPALQSERNSYYAGKTSNAADGGSYWRNPPISPLASPRDPLAGKLNRKNSGMGEEVYTNEETNGDVNGDANGVAINGVDGEDGSPIDKENKF